MDSNSKWIESLAASVVREFLYRKGLTKTLYSFETEFPPSENSINNRTDLIRELKIEKLVTKNKASSSPLRTLLEIISKDLQSKSSPQKSNRKQNNSQLSVTRTVESPIIFRCSGEKNIELKAKNSRVSDRSEDDFHSRTVNESNYITFTKNLAYEDENDESCSETKIEHLGSITDLNTIGHQEVIKTEATKNNIKGTPLLQTKTQFGAVHSSAENSSRQRRRLLSGEIPKNKHVLEYKPSSKANFQNSPSRVQKSITSQKPQVLADLTESLKITSMNPVLGKTPNKNKMGDLELCDLSDSELDFQPVSVETAKIKMSSKSIKITEACELREILFGNKTASFGPEWRRQAFTFSKNKEVSYGIVQNKGGPCGILAAVQAHVLYELLFNSYHDNCINGHLRPTTQACNMALVRALSTILWKAGSKEKAVVAIPSGQQVIDSHNMLSEKLHGDGFLEQLVLSTFTCFNSLFCFIKEKIDKFQNEGRSGCIIFLYSVILSRGIQKVKEDMDDPNTCLIGRYGYCTQEMVNLLIVGQAVSNVFDGEMELNTGGTEKTILHGIPFSSDIGLLSLFEHYKSCKVGNNYKNPNYPIWVVLSESHFSVLFAVSKEKVESGEPFNLFYFDGLSNQTEEYCLTVDPSPTCLVSRDNEASPIELCICTKWAGAQISWNGADPLL